MSNIIIKVSLARGKGGVVCEAPGVAAWHYSRAGLISLAWEWITRRRESVACFQDEAEVHGRCAARGAWAGVPVNFQFSRGAWALLISTVGRDHI